MKTDERIGLSKRHIASKGFGIWYILMLASLIYRQFYLGQTIDQYWDVVATFFIGAMYVSIAAFAQGAVIMNRTTRSFRWSALTILLTIIAVSYFRGSIASVSDLMTTIASAAIGIAFVAILFYALYRSWERSIDAP
jgi:hypothetical protein